jgi:hypothetical protein
MQVLPVGGKEKFKPNIENLPKLSKFDEVVSIGIIRDADNSYNSAFKSIQDALKAANLPLPERPLEPVSSGGLRVAVYIMPDNQSEGALEDLCLSSINDDPVYDCVQKYFDCLKDDHGITHHHISKSRVQVYLARHAPVDPRVGIAARKDIWRWDNPAFDSLKGFIKGLNIVES